MLLQGGAKMGAVGLSPLPSPPHFNHWSYIVQYTKQHVK